MMTVPYVSVTASTGFVHRDLHGEDSGSARQLSHQGGSPLSSCFTFVVDAVPVWVMLVSVMLVVLVVSCCCRCCWFVQYVVVSVYLGDLVHYRL